MSACLPLTIPKGALQALRREAAEAGNVACRILCDLAIDGVDSSRDDECLDSDGLPDYSGGGHDRYELAEIRRVSRLSQAEAIAECARVIVEAKARAERLLAD